MKCHTTVTQCLAPVRPKGITMGYLKKTTPASGIVFIISYHSPIVQTVMFFSVSGEKSLSAVNVLDKTVYIVYYENKVVHN